MLEDKYSRSNLAGITDKEDAPLEEAIAMLVREKLDRPASAAVGGAASSRCGATGSRTRPAST